MREMLGSGGRCFPGHAGPAGFLILILFLTSLLLSGAGCAEEEPPAVPERDGDAVSSSIPGLSAEQSRTVDELGYPDHFFISIDPISSDRIDTWTYFAEGKSLEFDNGRLVGETPIEDESAKYPPTELYPQDFDVLLTPGEAEELLGPPLYTYETTDSLMPENTLYFFENAVLIYRDGQLMGVNTQDKAPDLSVP
jgi:hypothetical protein